MEKKLFIPLLLGTFRKGRESEKVARLVFSFLKERPEVETLFLDPLNFNLPKNDYGTATADQVPEYKSAMERADGLVIVTPEYNHSYPGSLKAVLDTLEDEYRHKAVGVASVSSGNWGGTRAAVALLPVLQTLGLVSISFDLYFPKVEKLFDASGKPTDDSYERRIVRFLDEIIWMAKTLRAGREASL